MCPCNLPPAPPTRLSSTSTLWTDLGTPCRREVRQRPPLVGPSSSSHSHSQKSRGEHPSFLAALPLPIRHFKKTTQREVWRRARVCGPVTGIEIGKEAQLGSCGGYDRSLPAEKVLGPRQQSGTLGWFLYCANRARSWLAVSGAQTSRSLSGTI